MVVLPRRLVAGAPATAAVLDAQGRLTPGVTLQFTLGLRSDATIRITTDQTGRAVFTVPATPGVLFAKIVGRPDKVSSAVIPASETAAAGLQITSYPRFVSITDRFEISGEGFRGQADANQVTIGGALSLVLAASPVSLVLFAAPGLPPGPTEFQVESSGQKSSGYPITLVHFEFSAPTAKLGPGQHQILTVRARGTQERLNIEARDLSPEVADLAGGNPARLMTSGGKENAAQFEVVGRRAGDFLISIRLVPRPLEAPPAPARP
jgi:hypothetical protein